MRGLAILLTFNLLGLFLQRIGLPLPGPVIGLVLFTTCLFLRLIRLDWVETEASFLLRHMLLFFTPVIVGVIAFRALLAEQWLPITVGLVGSWLAVILLTGLVAKRLTKP